MNSNHSQIVKNYHELIEIDLVLEFKFKCHDILSSDKEEDFFHDHKSDLIKLGTITGMILSSRCASFEKVIVFLFAVPFSLCPVDFTFGSHL
jgi:hypothetical protein